MARLRFQPSEWMSHFVTMRNLQGFLFMRPSKHLNLIIAGCLAQSMSRYQGLIKVHAYVFMSNHYHMIVTAQDQISLSAFMSHFNGCLGKELAIHNDFHGKIWHKRYSSSLILDEQALEDRYRYIFANSVKEGLVSHPRDWPGLHSYRPICDQSVVNGIWIDRTGLYHARQRAQLKKNHGNPEPTEADFTTQLVVKLDGPPPLWAELSESDYIQRCRTLTDQLVQEQQDAFLVTGKSFMGAQAVQCQPILTKRFTKRSPCPLCHTFSVQLLKEFKAAYWDFYKRFKAASQELRTGISLGEQVLDVCFPEGGVPLFNSR